MLRQAIHRTIATVLLLVAAIQVAGAHTNINLTVNAFAPTNGPAGTVATVDFTYSIFHVGHNPSINNEWRVLLDGVVVGSGTNNHANTGSGNESYNEVVPITIPLGSPPGNYTITVQTLHSPEGNSGCSFATNNACRRTATRTFTIPNYADMSIDVSGLPTTADLNQPYAGTFTCSNDPIGGLDATNVTCSVTGLPAGVSVTGCVPATPTSVAPGATITCSVAGAPTASGAFPLTGTTTATNDSVSSNNTAATSITITGSDMSPDLSGLPTNTIVGVPYAGTFTCSNAGPNAAIAATCGVTGLPAGVTVVSCTPTPPVTIPNGSSITCSVAGTPSATTTANVTATTGASNDTNGGTGGGGNNVATASIAASAVETTKTASVTTALGNSATLTDAGDQVTYSITVQNIGTSTLTGVNVTDALTRQGGGGLTLTSGPSFISNDSGSAPGTLVSGETATYSASYTFVQADIDAGGVSNTATGRATSPGGTTNDVADTSDDGDDTDGNTSDDPTVSMIVPSPSLVIVKSATDATLREVGDIIVYTYTVTNTGNITINDVTVSDVHNGSGPPPVPGGEILFSDALPALNSTDGATNGSWDTLAPGDSVRFTGTYTVTQNDVDTLQ